MNRQQRRQMAKKIKGTNVMVGTDPAVDRSGAQYCWHHKLKLDDIDKPSERDKKLIESVRLVPHKVFDKNGNVTISRSCPRCGNTIYPKTALQTASKESIIEVPEGNEYADIQVPHMRENV